MVLSTGMACSFHGANLDAKSENITYTDVDAFINDNYAHMNNGKLGYIVGKKASDIGATFAAVMSALNGAPIRDADGNAISVAQGYGVAKTATEFQAKMETSTTYVYNKTLLDTIIGTKDKPVTLANFTTVVGQN